MRQIPYQKQAGLLLDILPLIDKHAAFALKGGTAINSVKKGEPQWELFGLDGIQEMPAVQWKLRNIRAMPRAKHEEAIDRLRRYLDAR